MGGFKRSLQSDKKSRCLVKRSLSCLVDRPKEILSDNFQFGTRPLIHVLPGNQGVGLEASLEPAAKLAFS